VMARSGAAWSARGSCAIRAARLFQVISKTKKGVLNVPQLRVR
jgi:hypothetical protein